MEIDKTRHFWEYRTIPPSHVDLAARIIVEPVCRLFIGTSKPSHGWNWKRYPYPESFEGNLVNANPDAFPPHNIVDFLRMESRWGWQRIRAIQPDLEALNGRRLDWWQYCWSPENKAFLDRCSVAIDQEEAIRVLIGPKPFRIHGYGSDNKEVPLIVYPETNRNDPTFKHLPLF